MNNIFILAKQQALQMFKSPLTLILFLFGPVCLIFVLGQALSAVYDANPAMPSAMEYFGITILTMAVMFGSFIASIAINGERKNNTILRLKTAPVKSTSVFIAKFAAMLIIIFLLGAAIILICSLLLNINYGTHIGELLLIIASLAVFSCSLGMSVSTLIENEKSASSILNSIVPLIIFLGGGYFAIPDAGFLKDISVISPLRWVNLAVNAEVLKGSHEYTLRAIIFCLALGIALIVPAYFITKRKGDIK